MVKVYDPDKKLRQVRNFVILGSAYSLVVIATILIACYSVFISINGIQKTMLLIKKPIVHQFRIVVYGNLHFLKYFWANKTKLGFNTFNFFVPKLLLSNAIPLGILSFVIVKYWNFILTYRIFKKESSLHGDAHWATEAEIKKSGLRAKKGMVMGNTKKGYLVCDGYQHSLIFAPTGSGKGVGFVIPNLLFWEESLICHDIKLENFELTSGWRRKDLKQKVYAWVPADYLGRSHCYNPMDWISEKPGQQVDDVQKLANILLPKQEFWTNEARTLLVGLMLYAFADPDRSQSFGEVVRLIRSDNFSYTLATVMDTMGDKIHPICYMNLAAFLGKADKERSGVVSTLNSGLELWGNPIIDATTARSDFDFTKFKIEKTTVYVGLTPDNIQRLQPLMKMFYQQATAFMSQHMPTPEEKYGVLFLMDEFPTVGKLEIFLSGIAYFRGYHVRLFLIVQDTQQLKGTYEDTGMNSFLSNSTYRITYAANNVETAKLISELIGTQTVEATSGSRAKYFNPNPGSSSVSVSQQSRALLMPQEVIGLPRDQQIVMIEASPPIRTEKIFYYKDAFFTKRLLPFDELPIQEPIIKKRPPKDAAAAGGAGAENTAAPADDNTDTDALPEV